MSPPLVRAGVDWLQLVLGHCFEKGSKVGSRRQAPGGRWLGAVAGRGSSSHLSRARRRAEGHARPWLSYASRRHSERRRPRQQEARKEGGSGLEAALCSALTAARSCNGHRAAVEGGTGPLTSPSVTVTTVSMTTRDARAPEDLAVAMVPRRGFEESIL